MSEPHAVTSEEILARRKRVTRMARDFGFTGRVEYRHIYGRTGGAQYGQGTTVTDDVLIVFAEAFERDATRMIFHWRRSSRTNGVSLDEATRRLQDLWNLLETLL